MRLLIGIVLAAGLLWAGLWFAGAMTLRNRIEAGYAQAAADGQNLGHADLQIAGFPNRFDVTVTEPFARDATTGWGWRAPFLQVFSMTWKPWHLIAVLPPEQMITLPDGQSATLTSDRLRGSLLLHPGLDLRLDRTIIEASGLRLTLPDAAWGLERLVLAAGEDTTRLNGLRLGLQAMGLSPDPARLFRVPDLGAVLAEVHLDLTLQLEAPFDRHLTETRFGVTEVHLTDVRLAWGPLVVSAKGSLSRSPQGWAEGEIVITIDHWQRLPDALVALGLLRDLDGTWLERALALFAQQSDTTDRLQILLVSKDGQTTLGGLPLGRAPYLPWATPSEL